MLLLSCSIYDVFAFSWEHAIFYPRKIKNPSSDWHMKLHTIIMLAIIISKHSLLNRFLLRRRGIVQINAFWMSHHLLNLFGMPSLPPKTPKFQVFNIGSPPKSKKLHNFWMVADEIFQQPSCTKWGSNIQIVSHFSVYGAPSSRNRHSQTPAIPKRSKIIA